MTAASFRPLFGQGSVRERDGAVESLHLASWCNRQITLDHRRWRCAEAELAWSSPHHLIVLTEDGGTARTQTRLGGRLVYEGHDRPGSLSVIPAAIDRQGGYRDVDLIYSALWIDPAVQGRLAGCPGPSALPCFVNGHDPVVGALVASLRDDVARGHTPDTAYVEHMVALILLRLAARDSAAQPAETRGGRLSRRSLAHVLDYVEANLGSDIALSDLADLLDMPVDRFARRFRATTGLAPYAYILERRVRRAETLLGTTTCEIAAIAITLGFSSQSHLTTTFRRLTGTTPRAYRAQLSS
jgi:AraC family transcriptional regulator